MIWIAVAAATLLVVFLLRKRRLAIWFALAIAAIAAVVWFFTETDSRRQSDQKAAVTVSATADPAVCVDPTLPVAVTFSNGSDRMIRRLSFDLIGTPAGQTTVVYRGYLRDDQVIPPGETVTRCYALLFHAFAHPRPEIIDATKYDWSARITLLDFGEPITR